MAMTLDGSNGVTFNDSSLQGAAASPYGLKNRIINGDMRIDQRNAGASVTPTGNAYTLDRWQLSIGVSSKLSVQRSTTAPTGFINSALITTASAYTASAADYLSYCTKIEGLNISDLAWGTASAKTVTLSFQVRSSLTGTFSGALQNNAASRSYPFTFSISSANTWETKSITIAGDTSGTWLTTNGIGIEVHFNMGSGSDRLGTAGAWNSNWNTGATGSVALVQTNGATFYITGVQLEIGTSATPFERRQYGQELLLCQRYYENTYDDGTKVGTNIGNDSQSRHGFAVVSNSKAWAAGTSYKVKKRTNPSVTLYDRAGTSGQWYWGTYGVNEATSATVIAGSCQNELQMLYTTSYPAGTNGGYGHFSADAEL